MTPEQRERYNAYQREYKRRRRQDPEFREAGNRAVSTRWHTDAEYREQCRARKRALYASKRAGQ